MRRCGFFAPLHGLQTTIAPLDLPLVIHLETDRSDQADERGNVRKDANNLRAPFDFAGESLSHGGGKTAGPVLTREGQGRQDILLGLREDLRRLRPTRLEGWDHLLPGLACRLTIRLGEAGAHGSRDQRLVTLKTRRSAGAQARNSAPLPGRSSEHLPQHGFASCLGSADHELDARQAPRPQAAQNL